MAGRILITGDMHGTYHQLFGLAEREALYETDLLLIAGDAGYVWDQDYPFRVETLQQLFPGTVAFVDGNHENHALLDRLPLREWHGGQVHQAGERVFHLMRGEIYSLWGINVFTFGGARSTDRDQREDGRSWWEGEEPTAQELEHGRRQLLERLDEIHYVITHESPLSARASFSRKREIDPDYRLPSVLEDWYQRLSRSPRFKKWYFGHLHQDRDITPRLRCIYNHFLPLGEDTPLRWV